MGWQQHVCVNPPQCSSPAPARSASHGNLVNLAHPPPWLHLLPAVLFSSIREECERMGVNERVLISDEAGRQFYVPPLRPES